MAFGAEGGGAPFEDLFVDTVDGLKLHARDYAAIGVTTGEPVVCLHGLTRNARDFEVVAARIAHLGRRVIVPDMRGRGESDDDPDPAHYVPIVYAQDVLTLMQRLGVARAVFVGTSMGGIVTMVIAALAPDRIAAAALNDVGPILDPAGVNRIATYVGRGGPVETWAAAAEAVRAVNGVAYPDRLDDDAFWMTWARRTWAQREDGMISPDYDPNIALAFTDAETAPPADMTPLFAALKDKPILSIRGALSDLLSPEGVAAMRALRADLSAVEVPSVGHAPTLEEPEAWGALLDFLARVP